MTDQMLDTERLDPHAPQLKAVIMNRKERTKIAKESNDGNLGQTVWLPIAPRSTVDDSINAHVDTRHSVAMTHIGARMALPMTTVAGSARTGYRAGITMVGSRRLAVTVTLIAVLIMHRGRVTVVLGRRATTAANGLIRP
jgi:hypothetical protein